MTEYYHVDKKTGVLSVEEQTKRVEKLINELKEKKLVITDRLHIAIPCIALGTPVIIKKRNYQPERFSIFDAFPEFPGFGQVIDRESGLKEKMYETLQKSLDTFFLK